MPYAVEAVPATPGLRERIAAEIRTRGPLGFPAFMAAALYDPQEGYYARGTGQVGREGDFFTSVSVGPLFGRLLARRIAEWHRQAGAPARWRIVELGAHDGALALDILAGLAELDPALAPEYATLEPLPALAAAQRERLAGRNAVVHPGADPLVADPLPTYLLANEVLDALPFHIVESTGGGWREKGVTLGPAGAFAWCDLGPVDYGLPLRPAGYRTEIRPDFRGFLAPLAAAMSHGRMLWIDYGFLREDYYDVHRTSGTLRVFRGHRAGEDPLEAPGGQDITAHVDFTAVTEAAVALGGTVVAYENQDRFLTRLARPWLLSLEGRTDPAARKELRAFQTLVHPAQLGSRFRMLEVAFGEDPGAAGRPAHSP